MLLSSLIVASLWASAAQAGARVDSQEGFIQAPTPVEVFVDALALDLAVNAAGLSADLMSTDHAISRGCVEGNPLVPRVEGRIALKIGLSALRGSVSYVLRRTGHKTLADVWRWSGLGTDLVITAHNLACGGSA